MSGSFETGFVSEQSLDARLNFLRRTYLHLVGAVVAFTVISFLLYQAGVGERVLEMVAGGGRAGWLLVLGGFMVVGWLASAMANSDKGQGMQYAGLGLYTVAEALIFSPVLFLAAQYYVGVLPSATAITLLTFGGLSFYVLMTKKDFSWLGTGLFVAMLVALGLIVCAAIFGFTLGTWFSGAMVLLACGAILYTTSKVLLKYRTDQYVAASLELFAAVALLFWYVLRLLMGSRR